MENLQGKCVILGVTGGIAAYKMASVASGLRKAGAEVHVIMTQNATQFITPLTFETLTNHRCVVDTFARDFQYDVAHISLAKASHNAILYRLMTTVDYEIEDSRQALYIKGNKSFDDGVLVDHFEVVRFIKESDGVGASIVMRHHLNRALEYLKNK